MGKLTAAFLRNRRGATTVEYAVMIAIGALALLGAIAALGDTLLAKFNSVGDDMEQRSASSGG